jgi:four helix bundle protein
MAFKFERLEVWQLAVDLTDEVYLLIEALPDTEKFNLTSQIQRAVTSVSLNIAEGSTGQTDPEQSRFIGYAHRSLMEVVACLILMKKRVKFLQNFSKNFTKIRKSYLLNC